MSHLLLAALLLEGLVRLLQGNAYPMLAFELLTDEVPRLAPARAVDVRFPGGGEIHYATDGVGARVLDASHAARGAAGAVLVVGDSQALGWGLPFEDTFASRVASTLAGEPGAARIMAAPRIDPERAEALVEAYATHHPEPHRACVFVLNLGNDLEELYLGRRNTAAPRLRPLVEWLGQYSILYQDLVLLRERLRRTEQEAPPGVQTILLALEADERVVLARHTLEALERTMARSPACATRAVVVIPSDIQADVREFDKYRPYYEDAEIFARWREAMPDMARQMDVLHGYLVGQLRARGVAVVDVRELAKAPSPEPFFDRGSHHLTAHAHARVAEVLLQALAGVAEAP